jgi:phosphoglycerate dehydrogenase-like enzyme
MTKPRVAILDDTQDVALLSADWTILGNTAEVVVFREAFADEAEAANRLVSFDVIVPMRERTPLPRSLLSRLPKLRMIALTGLRAPTLDLAACADLGITVSNTAGDHVTAATAELTWGLILACARSLPRADAVMRSGGWHEDVPVGFALEGRRIGIVGLGKLGSRVARYADAFGMEVLAWSQNLTAEQAQVCGARLVQKHELFSTADVVTLHLVLSGRTRGIVGREEIEALKAGSILVNTSRGPLIDKSALMDRLAMKDVTVGLDVFDEEPLPSSSPLRSSAHVVMAPHLGYSTKDVFRQFYGEALENIRAYLDGKPTRVITPPKAG